MNKWDCIKWWELRRVIFNCVVGACGLISLTVIEWIGGRYVKSGEDVIEPMLIIIGVIGYGIAANILYTLGWVTEIIWSCGNTTQTKPIRFKVFCAGTLLSALVTLIPAVFFPVAWAITGFK